MADKRITKKQVKHIASLAKIELTEEEIDKFRKQLGSIINYFDTLSEVDTEGVKQTSQVTGLVNKLRDDIARDFLESENALGNAPDKNDGYFRTRSPLNK